MRQLIDKLMQGLGYVRLSQYGYTLTREGRIVEVPKVIDDRFEPPPLALPSYGSEPTPAAVSLLPKPALPARPAPEQPAQLAVGTEPTPLFSTGPDGEPLGAEPPPAMGSSEDNTPAAPSAEAATEVESFDADEWEWKMALARARAQAEASAGEAPALQADALDAEELEEEDFTEVPDEPIRAAAPPPSAPVRATGSRPVPTRTMPLPSNRVRPARPRPAPAPSRKRSLTGIDLGTEKSQLPGTRRASGNAQTPIRKDIERAASRVVTPAAPHIRRRGPNGRIARGTEPLPAGKPSSLSSGARASLDVGDTTATDITALDRARQSMKPDEDTCVTLAAAAPADSTVDEAIDERTSVELTRPPIDPAPLPRLSARLRRAHQ